MRIRKYIEFIRESSESDFNSIGEWIESLISDQYVRNIVSRYLGDINPNISISNAINVLDIQEQDEIRYQVENYISNGIEDKDPEITTSTDLEDLMESESSVAGKGVFSSFMKTLTALGQKDMKPNWEKCPSDFLIFYYYPGIESDVVKQIFERFKSLVKFSGMIDYGKNDVSLYYGIKCDGTFEYGT